MTAALAKVVPTLPAITSTALGLSDVVSYNNLSRVADPSDWNYKGGPNLAASYTTFFGHLAPYASGNPSKLRLEWPYSKANVVAAKAGLFAGKMGCNINGYLSSVDGVFATRKSMTLYGGTASDGGGISSGLVDVTNADERSRLLGDDPNYAAYNDNQQGISNWYNYSQGFSSVIYDAPVGMVQTHTNGGSFQATTYAGFSGYGSAMEYGPYLKTLYADDAAYATARATPETVPGYYEYRKWMLDATRVWHRDVCKPRAASLGMAYAMNLFTMIPTEHPQTSFSVSDIADFGITELSWQQYARDGATGTMAAQRATAEDFTSTTNLLNYFASISLCCATGRGIGKRQAMALWPMLAWLPPSVAGAGTAPQATSWTIPYKVKAAQRLGFGWLMAQGVVPIVPSGLYDEAVDIAAAWPAYSGFTGLNKTLFYGHPNDYADVFQFIGRHGETLFDNFEIAPSAAMVVPIITSYWGGASGGRHYDYVNSYCRPLVTANVPFVLLPVGGVSLYIPTSTYDLTQYQAVFKTEVDGWYGSWNAAVPTGVNVLAPSALAGSLTAYAPITITGATDGTRPVLAIPRMRSDGKALAIHLVNTNSCDYSASSGAGAANATQSALRLAIKPWAMLSRGIRTATFWQPGQFGGVACAVEPGGSGATIRVPPLTEWAVLLVEFT